MAAGLFLGVVVGCAAVSVFARAAQIRRTLDLRAPGEVQPQASPLSKALEEALATAAGIYVALSATASFLGLRIPDVSLPGGIRINPVPALALLLTIVQPLFGR
ncbi:MAG: hypothetical protein NUV93_05325 [Firmicutes bacterium]|jgi:hypothetical protein|nr:hypothetical protein [Bacillota bacterium]